MLTNSSVRLLKVELLDKQLWTLLHIIMLFSPQEVQFVHLPAGRKGPLFSFLVLVFWPFVLKKKKNLLIWWQKIIACLNLHFSNYDGDWTFISLNLVTVLSCELLFLDSYSFIYCGPNIFCTRFICAMYMLRILIFCHTCF